MHPFWTASRYRAATSCRKATIVPFWLLKRRRQNQQYQQQYNQQPRMGYHELSYTIQGDPIDVVSYHQSHDGYHNSNTRSGMNDDGRFKQSLLSHQVLVEMIAAPWNPADVNSIQGRYASPYGDHNTSSMYHSYSRSCYFPDRTVIGSEGWGRIIDIRTSNTSATSGTIANRGHNVQVGDFVAIGLSGLGTMRSSMWVPASAVIPINRGKELYNYRSASTDTKNDANNVDALASVSTLFQLGGTALRMLQDFEHLQHGDIVIQNAGTSGVAFMLTQLASVLYETKKIFTVSLIRRGNRQENEYNTLLEHLMTVGKADLVVAEDDDQFTTKTLIEEIKQLSNGTNLTEPLNVTSASLAINAVGGESASTLIKVLGPGKTLVTYGGMSMKPITIGTPQFIFNDLRAVGYWQSRWMYQNSLLPNDADRRHQMINQLVDLFLDGHIIPTPTKGFRLDQFKDALNFEKNQQQRSSTSTSSRAIRHKIAFCL